MGAAKYDRLINLMRYTTTEDTAGQPIQSFVLLKTVPAYARTISDGERLQGGGVFSSISDRFLIRWSSDISDLNPKDRIHYNGKVYDIVGVKEIGRRKELEITTAARSDE